ncbi:alpha/beta hydrolase [Duganella sp. sic0402]|uniref:alpha/beta fold hydrolase n=1 Tax=Duganella sp. sic0402 TaxID=2854786 RepID=UPI001C441B0B|nr:alpha/beta hydrolase [Duganella sp. sic0402]MBV7537970.1 alpha/beta hydrolase [Duganella sp. sic0402]
MFTIKLRRLLAVLLLATVLQAQARDYTATAPDGVTLAVQESGNPDGMPVIFIHGLLGSRLNWSEQLASPQLQGYRLITYDLRGHGLSAKPAGTQAYSDGRRWADDLRAVIQAANARKPVLVGWSLGGAVISNYLAAYGDQDLAAAVYVDGVIELAPEQITAHPDIYRDLISNDLRTHLDAINTFLRLCFQTPPAVPVLERLLANAAMASWDMQRGVQSMTVPADQGLRAASVPLLLLYGEQDALVRPGPSIARAVALNPGIHVKRYAQSGHAPFLEEAQRFNQDLAAFIAQLR